MRLSEWLLSRCVIPPSFLAHADTAWRLNPRVDVCVTVWGGGCPGIVPCKDLTQQVLNTWPP